MGLGNDASPLLEGPQKKVSLRRRRRRGDAPTGFAPDVPVRHTWFLAANCGGEGRRETEVAGINRRTGCRKAPFILVSRGNFRRPVRNDMQRNRGFPPPAVPAWLFDSHHPPCEAAVRASVCPRRVRAR